MTIQNSVVEEKLKNKNIPQLQTQVQLNSLLNCVSSGPGNKKQILFQKCIKFNIDNYKFTIAQRI